MRWIQWNQTFAWLFCALVFAWSLFAAANTVANRATAGRPLYLAAGVIEALLPVLFAIPATLIVMRQPRNTIGWLMMIAAVDAVLSDMMNRYLATFQAAPPPADFPHLFMVWFVGASWLGAIFPLLLIPLFFPTGRLLTPRWRWAVYLAAGMCLFFLVMFAFAEKLQTDPLSWIMDNPIGFLPQAMWQLILPVWAALLFVLTGASITSIIIRYLRATAVEREQMKWLLFASAIFTVIYVFSLMVNVPENPPSQILLDLSGVLLNLAVVTIPAAMAAAILRYHLFDIDVIIRLTLIYALVTGLLGLTYLGGVILLQESLRALSGQASDIAIVATTLAAAALFSPLRQRIQAVIDRRFYRQKYNAEQTIAQFAAAARSGSDLDALTAMLEEVVQVNLQPTRVNLTLVSQEEGSRRGE